MFIINDDNYKQFINPVVDGKRMGTGLVPRDLNKHPLGCYSSAVKWDMSVPLIPESEWIPRIRERKKRKAGFRFLREIADNGKPIKSLNQNGQGYCWAYSTVGAIQYIRMRMGLPYVRLSAHAVGCKVKNFRDQGGWSAQSLDFIVKHGVPSVEHWKEQSMSRSNDTAETWENAKRHVPTEGWVELDAPIYDRDLSYAQVVSCLLSDIPVACDFNWWGHAVVAIDVDEVDGEVWPWIDNSWGNWGQNGLALLQGSKGRPDNAVAPRVVRSAA